MKDERDRETKRETEERKGERKKDGAFDWYESRNCFNWIIN